MEQELDDLQPLSDVLRAEYTHKGKVCEENDTDEPKECTSKGKVHEQNDIDEPKGKRKKTKEEKLRVMEEKRLQKEVRVFTIGSFFVDYSITRFCNQFLHLIFGSERSCKKQHLKLRHLR